MEGHSQERAHTHGHGDEPDRVALTHIGLDVGAATVKLLACRLVLASHGHGHEDLRVAQRQVLFRSPVLALSTMSADGLRQALPRLWADAPLGLDAADTRLAVLTGPQGDEGEQIGPVLAKAGFDAVAAGPHLAGVLAAYGSDAAARSTDPHGEPRTIVNVDLGATSARLALCRGGEILETTAIRAGPRLVTLDEDARVASFDPALGPVAEAADVRLAIGAELSATGQKALADELAECLLNLLEPRPLQVLTRQLLIADPFEWSDRLNGASFSGGAARYVYEGQAEPNGDLGPALGRAIRQRLNRLGFAVQEPEHVLTATIIGSAQYRMEDVHSAPIWAEPPSFSTAQARDAQLAARAL